MLWRWRKRMQLQLWRKTDAVAAAEKGGSSSCSGEKSGSCSCCSWPKNADAAEVEAKKEWTTKMAACAKKANVCKKSLADYMEQIPAQAHRSPAVGDSPS